MQVYGSCYIPSPSILSDSSTLDFLALRAVVGSVSVHFCSIKKYRVYHQFTCIIYKYANHRTGNTCTTLCMHHKTNSIYAGMWFSISDADLTHSYDGRSVFLFCRHVVTCDDRQAVLTTVLIFLKGSFSCVCQFLNFENQTIIGGDMAKNISEREVQLFVNRPTTVIP